MKPRCKKLELRPIVPGFLKIIPRLPAMVCKKEILFKIFTPITYIFRGIKGMFKRKPSARMIRHAALEMKNQCLANQKKGYLDYNVQHKRSVDNTSHHPELAHDRKIVAETFKWQGPRFGHKTCLSCNEDRPAYNTCTMCQELYSTLPPSSCKRCRREKPQVNLCMQNHKNQPVIYLRNEEKDLPIYRSFIEELRKRQKRHVSMRCNGKSHSINNCPMCLCFWPTVGECMCLQCKLNQPVIKVFSSQSYKKMMIDICPCVSCTKKHPKMKVCRTCKVQRKAKIKEDTSFYVLLQ